VLHENCQYAAAHRCIQICPQKCHADTVPKFTLSQCDMHSVIIKQGLSGHCPDRHHFPTAYARKIRCAIQGVFHANRVYLESQDNMAWVATAACAQSMQPSTLLLSPDD